MHVYKELRFEGNKPGLDSLAKNIYTVFPIMSEIKLLMLRSQFIMEKIPGVTDMLRFVILFHYKRTS